MLRCVRLPLLGTTLPERSPTTGARTPGRPLVSRTRARLPASMSSEAQLKVVFVTTEVAPWSKVGGLADVCAALPAALAARGHNVMTVAPRYDAYPDTEPTGVNVPLTLPGTLAPSGMEASQPGSDKAAPPASTHATDASPHTGLRRRRRGRRRKVPEDLPASAISRNDDSAIGSAVTGDEPSTACFTEAALFSTHQCGVERVFVDHPLLRTANIYSFEAPSAGGPALTYLHGGEHSDLHIRYSILCQAALAAAALLPPVTDGSQQASEAWDTNSRAKVVFVANDWPTALVLLRLRYDLQRQPPQVTGRTELDALLARRLATAATAMCIHNLAYQGQFPASTFPALALPDRALGALCTSTPWQDVLRELTETSGAQGSGLCPCGQQPATSWYPCCEPASVDSGILTSAAPGAVPELAGACSGGELNFMRAALLACDEVVTVSPCYAEEIQTDPAMACGTQDILVAKGVTGIMNGIDVQEWDPATDPLLPEGGRFDATCFPTGKAHMKALLQRRLGLAPDPEAPLLVFIGRLTEQKGVDVLLGALPAVLAGPPAPAPVRHSSGAAGTPSLPHGGIQFAMLGTGDAWMQTALGGLDRSFPGQAAGITAFSEELAHWLLAAADYVLVPSRFEPCGLVAQCAARYGAVPIVTAVGGLKDLVTPSVGYALHPLGPAGDASAARADVRRVAEAMLLAGRECSGPRHRAMQRTCMALDLSWDRPAEEWEALLLRLASLRAPKTAPEVHAVH